MMISLWISGNFNVLYFFSFQDYVFKYHGQKLGFHEPHVFALAEAAYRNLKDNDDNQVIAIFKIKIPGLKSLYFIQSYTKKEILFKNHL
jgi:hypothetical protein